MRANIKENFSSRYCDRITARVSDDVRGKTNENRFLKIRIFKKKEEKKYNKAH